MEASKRMMVNTLVQYLRSVVNMVLMLFTTRFVLGILGDVGYGVYSVVGSTVFLMGFITNSLASSTQRFLSFSTGKHDVSLMQSIFANALLLHAGIAMVLVMIMGLLGKPILGGLTIPDEMRDASQYVYYMVLLMVLLSFLASPVRALFIARENIVYVSVVEIADSVLKFSGVLLLPFIPLDSLKVYATLLAMISLFNLLVYFVYGCIRFEECHVPRLGSASVSVMKKLTGFAVWNIYAVGAGVLRTQGFAIVINNFLGPVVNAAYGVTLQVQNALSFVVQSILNAMNPQLMRAEGEGNRARMIMLSTKESKYSFLILALCLTPLIMEMPGVLRFWLGNAPEHAAMFCRYSLVALMLDQLTIGLTSANQAIGRIRNYSLLISTMRIMELPLAWWLLHEGMGAEAVMWAYVGVEVLIGIVRVPFLKVTAGFGIISYCRDACLCCMPSLIGIIAAAWLAMQMPDHMFRFLSTEIIAVAVGMVLVYMLSLTSEERAWVKSNIKKL